MAHEDIEIQLWEYIDGICSDTDSARIARLISEDAAWNQKHNELLAFNAEISRNLELDQPSLRFTKNVMEAVAAAHIAPATKKYINPAIIRGIAAFFVLMIATLLIYTFAITDWHSSSSPLVNSFSIKKIEVNNVFKSSYINIILMVNVVLALLIIDKVLRKKRVSNEI